LCEGLEGFEEHEILEFLLFYALPRVDTNVIAHQLIITFGSLSAVLEADPKDIERVGGIGPKASAFLAMVPDVFRAYERSKLGKKPALRSIADACGFARTLLFGKPYEQFYVIWLGTQNRVIHHERLSEGSVSESPVYISRLAAKALRHHAVKCVIAHNHPGGCVTPSKADIQTTQSVLSTLAMLGIELVDHIIVSDNEAFSFQADSLMGKREVVGREAYAAEYSGVQQLSMALKQD
jgi:DNA repair protein RadC